MQKILLSAVAAAVLLLGTSQASGPALADGNPPPAVCQSVDAFLTMLNRQLYLDGSEVDELLPIVADMGVVHYHQDYDSGRSGSSVTVEIRDNMLFIRVYLGEGIEPLALSVNRTTCAKVNLTD